MSLGRKVAEARSEAEQMERIQTIVFDGADQACRELAMEIAELIRSRAKEGKRTVLGLATGSTPVRLYREMIRLHREEGLSFATVTTFNLDEYYPLDREHRESYWRFMCEQLFDHIDIPRDQVHLPRGDIDRSETFRHCQEYEEKIAAAGGIDLQILGIGRTGHIGFNEPGSGRDSRTRLVSLDSVTRRDAARDFLGEANVPRYAITMGVGTILEARRIVLLAWGESKATALARAVEQAPSDAVPASFLQGHGDCRFIIDRAAASALTRFRFPWKVGTVEWTPEMTRKAVVWLSTETKTPILKLVDAQYSEHSLAELLTEQGPAYVLNIRLFNELQRTITGWPGGKPNADDSSRPERALPYPKRVVIFSPEPQDDVVCLGGTLHRLVDQGHQVEVYYLTSGNLAVPDEEALFVTDLVLEMEKLGGDAAANRFASRVREQLAAKGPYDSDTPDIRRIKSLVRRSEARAACRICGIGAEHVHFLDLPFYEEGRYRQFKIGERDIERIREVLQRVRPHQVYLTGSQSDPSSVAGVSYEVIRRATIGVMDDDWFRDCHFWLYRGAGLEWDAHEIEMAVPLSPDELANKIKGIYQHQSQRSQTPLADPSGHREFWQQAEARNEATARVYDGLGLPEYAAIEAFRRWHPEAELKREKKQS